MFSPGLGLDSPFFLRTCGRVMTRFGSPTSGLRWELHAGKNSCTCCCFDPSSVARCARLRGVRGSSRSVLVCPSMIRCRKRRCVASAFRLSLLFVHSICSLGSTPACTVRYGIHKCAWRKFNTRRMAVSVNFAMRSPPSTLMRCIAAHSMLRKHTSASQRFAQRSPSRPANQSTSASCAHVHCSCLSRCSSLGSQRMEKMRAPLEHLSKVFRSGIL